MLFFLCILSTLGAADNLYASIFERSSRADHGSEARSRGWRVGIFLSDL